MKRLLVALILMSLLATGGEATLALDACALASPVALNDACSFPARVEAIDAQISELDDDRFTLHAAGEPIDSKYLPAGWSDGATWNAELPAGGGAHWVSLLEYQSADDLARFRIDYELALRAEFFVPAAVRSLDAPDACFTLLREESARGICLLERNNLLIVGYSFFETDIVEGQLATALALARVIDDAFRMVDGPGGLG